MYFFSLELLTIMKQLTNSYKGIALAISAFVFFACCGASAFGQGVITNPTCFAISSVVSASTPCNPTQCSGDGNYCSDCIDVTIYSCDNNEWPDEFQISAQDNGCCFSVCSPT